MSDILVLGSGLTGLTAAMLLARDGHAVTVLDRDPAPPPEGAEAAWREWARPGVAQFRQLHFLLPRWRAIMADELPDVLEAMLAAGAARTNVLHQRPAAVTGGWRPGDERFDAVTARRPVIEAAVARVAARTPGVTIRRGVRVTGLVTAGRSAVPRVVGVRTDGGDVECEAVVVCGGMYAAEIAALVDVRIPVVPMSHQYVVTAPVPGMPARLPSLRDPDLLVYYRQEIDGLVMGGYERQSATA